MESGPAIPTVVFSGNAAPYLHMDGFEYTSHIKPTLHRQLWYCSEYRSKKCKGSVSTSKPLYKLEVHKYCLSETHNHPRGVLDSFSTKCSWILYKLDFSRFNLDQNMAEGMIKKGEVSTVNDMLTLLQNNKIEGDDPAASGRCHYCFFQSNISTEWKEGSDNRFGGKFILSFQRPSEVTPENLHDYWTALLTCIMQGAFGINYQFINGAKVIFSGNNKDTLISVWTRQVLAVPEPEAPQPTMGQMLSKLFKNLVDVKYSKHVASELYY